MRNRRERIGFANGGPNDGSVQEFTEPFSETIEIHGPQHVRTNDDGAQLAGHKIYEYRLQVVRGHLTYVYYGESLNEWFRAHAREVDMGIRKHGVGGQIIDDDQNEENLSKQAATSEWSDLDEESLSDENEG
jgi:hypothetical protein